MSSPTPPEKEKCAARAAVLHSLIWSHSYLNALPLAEKRTVAFYSHSQVYWIAASQWIYQGQSFWIQLSEYSFVFYVILNVSFYCIDETWTKSWHLQETPRIDSESCIAQNLCSLTINLQERGASPSHRMRVARWVVLHGLGQGVPNLRKEPDSAQVLIARHK